MRPPEEAPKLLAWTWGLIGCPLESRGVKSLTAVNLLFCPNQNPVPWSWFVPLLVVVVTSVTCMNSALLLPALTLNSSIDSTDGNSSFDGPPPRVRCVEMPSIENDVMNGSAPATAI